MPLLEALGLNRSSVSGTPDSAAPVSPTALHEARLAVEKEIAERPPELDLKMVRKFVERKAPDLAAWLPPGSVTGSKVRRLASGGTQRLDIAMAPAPPQTTAGTPQPDGSLRVGLNINSVFKVDADRVARALVVGKLPLRRNTIRALIDTEVVRGVGAQLMHELTHAAIRFENALPRAQQTMMTGQPTSIIEKLREHQASMGIIRDQKLIFDVQDKLKALLSAADIVPTQAALKEHEQRLIEEKFAADQGEGSAGIAFSNLDLAEGTLATILKANPDLDERRRKIVIDRMAPALAKLYDQMDAIRLR